MDKSIPLVSPEEVMKEFASIQADIQMANEPTIDPISETPIQEGVSQGGTSFDLNLDFAPHDQAVSMPQMGQDNIESVFLKGQETLNMGHTGLNLPLSQEAEKRD